MTWTQYGYSTPLYPTWPKLRQERRSSRVSTRGVAYCQVNWIHVQNSKSAKERDLLENLSIWLLSVYQCPMYSYLLFSILCRKVATKCERWGMAIEQWWNVVKRGQRFTCTAIIYPVSLYCNIILYAKCIVWCDAKSLRIFFTPLSTALICLLLQQLDFCQFSLACVNWCFGAKWSTVAQLCILPSSGAWSSGPVSRPSLQSCPGTCPPRTPSCKEKDYGSMKTIINVVITLDRLLFTWPERPRAGRTGEGSMTGPRH